MFEESFLAARVGERDAVVRRCVAAALLCQTTIALSVWLAPLLGPPRLEVRPSAPPLQLPPVPIPPPAQVRPIRAVQQQQPQPEMLTLPQTERVPRAVARGKTAMPPVPSLTPLWGSATPVLPLSALAVSSAHPAVHVVATGSDYGQASKASRARVSSGVSEGLLLGPIRPVYPQIAIAARMEGTVVVEAVISREGTILRAHVSSGPTMLAQAALDAIRSAHYRPFRLNGEPTEVETRFSVVFRLGGR